MSEHPVIELEQRVNSTHPNLGRGYALGLITVAAEKVYIVVAPKGMGKSRLVYGIADTFPQRWEQQSLTMAGLEDHQEMLSGFQGCVLIDDIGAIDNDYSRRATLTTLTDLAYRHSYHKTSNKVHLDIEGFHGGVVMGIQPVLLKQVISSGLWESNIGDKAIRYYHLYRPLNPNPAPIPEYKVERIPNSEIEYILPNSTLLGRMYHIGLLQWGKTRVVEHVRDMLMATAGLAGRTKTEDSDAEVLVHLMNPMQIESWITYRSSFESPIQLNLTLLYFLTQFASYDHLTVEQFATDFQMGRTTTTDVLRESVDYWQPGKKPLGGIKPTKETLKLLEALQSDGVLDYESTPSIRRVSRNRNTIRFPRSAQTSA